MPISAECFPEKNRDAQLQAIYEILGGGSGGGGAGFALPTYDNGEISYVGSTNNMDVVTLKLGAATVGTITFTYVGGVPVANDALIATFALS